MATVGSLNFLANIGLQSVEIRPLRYIGPFMAQVTLEELHTDDLEITEHPIETGARITDHAFMKPAEVMIKCGWSNSPNNPLMFGTGLLGALGAPISAQRLVGFGVGAVQFASALSGQAVQQVRDIYANLLELQRARIPFQVATGKRLYNNMLVKSLRTSTSLQTENSLIVEAVLRQVLLVSTQVVSVGAPMADQAQPQSTAPVQNQGNKSLDPAPSYNAGAGRGSINPTLP